MPRGRLNRAARRRALQFRTGTLHRLENRSTVTPIGAAASGLGIFTAGLTGTMQAVMDGGG